MPSTSTRPSYSHLPVPSPFLMSPSPLSQTPPPLPRRPDRVLHSVHPRDRASLPRAAARVCLCRPSHTVEGEPARVAVFVPARMRALLRLHTACLAAWLGRGRNSHDLWHASGSEQRDAIHCNHPPSRAEDRRDHDDRAGCARCVCEEPLMPRRGEGHSSHRLRPERRARDEGRAPLQADLPAGGPPRGN